MKRSVLAGLAAVLFGLAGLAAAQEPPRQGSTSPASAAPAAFAAATNKLHAAAQYTVLGYLEKRDRVITIKSSPRGTIYSVSTKDGRVLWENLSLEQLKTQAPEVHEWIKRAVAGGSGGEHGAADARLRLSALR